MEHLKGGNLVPSRAVDECLRPAYPKLQTPVVMYTDSKSLVDHLHTGAAPEITEDRLYSYLGILDQGLEEEVKDALNHCSGPINPPLTC